MQDNEEMPDKILVYCHDKGTRNFYTYEKEILASFDGWGYTWVVHNGLGADNAFHVSEITSGCKIPVEGSTIEQAEKLAKLFLVRYTREVIQQTITNQREFVASRRFEKR